MALDHTDGSGALGEVTAAAPAVPGDTALGDPAPALAADGLVIAATAEPWSHRRSFVVWLPVWTLSVLLAVGWLVQPNHVFDPGWLFAPLNFVFLTLVPIAAAALAVPVYRRTGTVAMLALGAGMLVTGVGGGVLPAAVLYVRDNNASVTIHNTAAVVAAACQFIAALSGVLALSLGSNRIRHVVVVYGLAAIVMTIGIGVYTADAAPSFWDDGPTTGRQVVLFTAIALAVLSAAMWWQTSVRDPTVRFLHWYVPGLALLALGLSAIFNQTVVGGLVGWIGRIGQYAAALYMLVAVMVETQALQSRPGRSLGVSLMQASMPLQPLVESTSDAVFVVSRRGRVVYWNEAAHRLFGYDSGQALDREAVDLLLSHSAEPRQRDELGRLLQAAMHTVRPIRRQMILANRDGDEFQAEVSVFPNPSDRRMAICLVSDVSERVRARLELERRVLERTSELEALNDALERANDAKDEFLGLVSHELKTPITSIITAGSMLKRRLAETEGEFLADDLLAEAARLAGIIDNLLALARLDSGRALDHEPVLLDHVLTEAVRGVGRQFPERRVAVNAQAGVVVDASTDQLGMVFRNYMANALKYSPEGSEVEARVSAADGRALVEILDRGIGIEGEDPLELYEPFYRGSGTGRTAGMGIGLTVCLRIVESLGGSVGARPRPDGGSIFSFTLPLVRVEPDEVRRDGMDAAGPVRADRRAAQDRIADTR